MGGYAGWAASMRDFYRGWLIVLLVFLGVEWGYFKMRKKFIEKKIDNETKI